MRGNLLNVAFAGLALRRHKCQRRGQFGAHRMGANFLGNLRATERAAATAGAPMALMLCNFRDHRRQLGDLVTRRLWIFWRGLLRQARMALGAKVWQVTNHFVDVLRRQQLSVVPRMSRLAAWLSAAGRAC